MLKCRICHGKAFKTLLPEFASELGEVYALKLCNRCSFISVDPLPTPENLRRYYNRDYWQWKQNQNTDLLNLRYKLMIKTDYFSHRHSPSITVLSLFPSIAPQRVRRKNSGRYPLPLMVLYLILQLAAYPFSLVGPLLKKGEIIRMYVRKIG